jgi:hypothetical protein
MENKPNNPQAYPRTAFDSKGDITTFDDEFSGMTLRDYFANSAMQGLLSNPNWMKEYKGEKYIMQKEIISSFSYEIADAMLKQREK